MSNVNGEATVMAILPTTSIPDPSISTVSWLGFCLGCKLWWLHVYQQQHSSDPSFK